MVNIKAINWHRDGWIETEAALVIEGTGDIAISVFLPAFKPDQNKPDQKLSTEKTVAIWDGQTTHRILAKRGAIVPVATFRLGDEPLRLHVFCEYSEANSGDARRLGGVLRVTAAEPPSLDLRFDRQAPGRTFLPHPDRATVTEFMNIPEYCQGFPPHDVPSDPVLHYLTLGWVLGRDPARGFSTATYLSATPELAESGVNPFVHYLRASLGDDGSGEVPPRDPQVVKALAARLRGDTATADPVPSRPQDIDVQAPAAPPDLPRSAMIARADEYLAVGNRAEALRLAKAGLEQDADAAAARALLPQIVGTTESWDRISDAMDALFDATFYEAHAEVPMTEGLSPADHYLITGWKKGLRPSALFCPDHYSAQMHGGLPDRAFPLAHFRTLGQPAGLRGVPDGTMLWQVPPLPRLEDWNALPPAPLDTSAASVYIVALKSGPDPRPAIFALLANRRSLAYEVTAIVDEEAPGDWLSVLQDLARDGKLTLISVQDGSSGEAALNAALLNHDARQAAVLLSPDAIVHDGWFDRLASHALSSDAVATVTTLSTHADFAAYPTADKANLVSTEVSAEEIDRLAGRCNAGLSVAAPGAGGACVLITGAALRHLEGMEVDGNLIDSLTRRAARAGLRNLVACDLFVARVGPSVPQLPRRDLQPKGLAEVERTDPFRADSIRRYQQAKPLREARLRLDIARIAASARGGTVHLTHRMGGGIETYLHTALRGDEGAAVLRLHDGACLTVEMPGRSGLHLPNLAQVDLRSRGTLVTDLVNAVSPSRVVLHSLSGLAWPTQMQVLNALIAAQVDLDFIGHDYAAISAQYCLFAPDGSPWRGPPDIRTLQAWATMSDPIADLGAGDPSERQAAFGRLFSRASRRIVPSAAAAEIFGAYFHAHRFEVVSHPPHLPPQQKIAPRKPDGGMRVAVVGRLWPQKGSRVIEALAAASRARELPLAITLVGSSDIDDRLRRLGVVVTGAYRRESDAIDHLRNLSPDFLFIPSVWPETFCYTLSFAEALGLRAVAFDLGAQGERVRAMAGGVVLPLSLASDPLALSSAFADLADAA